MVNDAAADPVGRLVRSDPAWDTRRFHDGLMTLLGISSGEVVLDLGCGRSAYLGALLAGGDGLW